MSGVGDGAVDLVEVTRGGRVESVHRGHAIVVGGGAVLAAWGDPATVIYPRSSCKMIQALPLVESGAADGLSSERLALACASHDGAAIHTSRVSDWLGEMGMTDDDLRCGVQMPDDRDARTALVKSDESPCQVHNNCSGKHAGFLTLNRHLGGGPDYVEPDHPVQRAVRSAFEETAGEDSPGYGIDGCSAPNFAVSLAGLGRAMAAFATAGQRSDARSRAMVRLTTAMMTHPELVAGEGRACTKLMRAGSGLVAKTGAEGVFVAILPDSGLGVALKIADGTTRASECAIAAILVRLGALAADDPVVQGLRTPRLLNRRGIDCGEIRPAAALAL